VLPLLFVLGRDLDFATLGPFADAWWVTLVLAIVGLTFAADALVRTMTLLRRISRALDQGYDFDTIKLVVADGDRDMGYLLTGSRYFSDMDAKEREAMAALRVFSVTMYAIAGVWLPNALAIGILLGARGLLTPAQLWMGTALPSLAMYVFGSVAGTVAESRVRRARKRWYRQPWIDDHRDRSSAGSDSDSHKPSRRTRPPRSSPGSSARGPPRSIHPRYWAGLPAAACCPAAGSQIPGSR
jgi:hypothetical protein